MIILKDWKNKSGIYLLTNLINNKIYVGQSKDLYSRFFKYKNKSNSKTPIYLAISKYLPDSFHISILEFCSIEQLDDCEQKWIDYYKPFVDNNQGYCIRKIAKSNKGYKMKEETKIKLSIAKKGSNNYNFGKNLSESHKKAISEGNKGKVVSQETRKKLSISKIGNIPANKGKKSPHSLERILAIKEGLRKRRETKELDKGEVNIEDEQIN